MMDLEITIESGSNSEKDILFDITYKWNLNTSTNELICKTVKGSQT